MHIIFVIEIKEEQGELSLKSRKTGFTKSEKFLIKYEVLNLFWGLFYFTNIGIKSKTHHNTVYKLWLGLCLLGKSMDSPKLVYIWRGLC